MNAAISAAVVLASRLYDDLSVFSLTLFSVQVFALSPILRHRLQVWGLVAAEELMTADFCLDRQSHGLLSLR